MRKLVFILIAFIAAATFIRAFDNDRDVPPPGVATNISTIDYEKY
jgi:hypothetical protein